MRAQAGAILRSPLASLRPVLVLCLTSAAVAGVFALSCMAPVHHEDEAAGRGVRSDGVGSAAGRAESTDSAAAADAGDRRELIPPSSHGGNAARGGRSLAGLLAAHGVKEPDVSGHSPVARDPRPEAILLVSGNTAGWITPCGCPGSQAGGVARRMGYGELLRSTFAGVPVVYFDQGGFNAPGHQLERALTAAVIDAMNRIGYEGVNVASRDLGSTFEESEFIGKSLRAARLSANVVFHDTGEAAFPPYRILSFPPRKGDPGGPLRVGVIGVTDSETPIFAFGPRGRSLTTIPMEEALRRYLPELRSKSDLVILLADAPTVRLGAVMPDITGIDFIVGGGVTEFITEPASIEGVPLVAVGNQGKYLAELRIYRKEGRPEVMPFVHWLDEKYPENEELARTTEAAIDRINELSRKELAEDTSGPVDISPYVGAEACATCHAREYGIWKDSRHARAIEVLQRLKRDYTTTCVYCHVTGYGSEDGGFANLKATPQLANVQCEQCHGPARAHLADPAQPYKKPNGIAPELDCKGCHTKATDPSFDYGTRWKIIAHGAGEPLETPAR